MISLDNRNKPIKFRPPDLDLQQQNNNNNNETNLNMWYIHKHSIPLSPLDQIRPLIDIKMPDICFKAWPEETDGELLEDTTTPDKESLLRFSGSSLLSVSYQAQPNLSEYDGAFVTAFNNSLNSSLNVPFVSSPSKDKDSSYLFPTAARSPYKALLTINANTGIILMSNKVAGNMFGYSKETLVGKKIEELFTEPYRSKQRALIEQNIDVSGESVLVSGKVVSH